jgi:hypothetical protein
MSPPVVLKNHARILAGNISFGQNNTDPAKNLVGSHAIAIVTPSTPNTEFSFVHNLGFIPTRFWVTSMSAAGQIYKSTTAWTTTTVYLKCTTASVTISLFID